MVEWSDNANHHSKQCRKLFGSSCQCGRMQRNLNHSERGGKSIACSEYHGERFYHILCGWVRGIICYGRRFLPLEYRSNFANPYGKYFRNIYRNRYQQQWLRRYFKSTNRYRKCATEYKHYRQRSNFLLCRGIGIAKCSEWRNLFMVYGCHHAKHLSEYGR